MPNHQIQPVEFHFKKQIEHLYIHVPFCKNKCSYCAFHSVAINSASQIEHYLIYLENEFKKLRSTTSNLKTIYIGGGTPNILSAKQLAKLFSLIRNNFEICNDAEISIEGNPDSFSKEKIEIISTFANRISIGVQSFSSKHRNTIGRKSSPDNIKQIISRFNQNGITNISCDLIYAIPNQSLNDFIADLKKLTVLPIKHISLYSLTYEEGTILKKELKHSENEFDELSAEMWSKANLILSNNNIMRYEVSNYALEGFESKHNLNTWFGGKLLGIGPTASSFDGIQRWTNPTLKELHNNKSPDIDKIPVTDRFIEIFAMGLRTCFPWIIIIKNGEVKITSQYSNFSAILRPYFFHLLLKKINYFLITCYFLKIDITKNSEKLSKEKQNAMILLLLSNCDLCEVNIEISLYSTEHGKLFWDSLYIELMDILS